MEKWHFPEGGSAEETVVVAGSSVGQTSDSNTNIGPHTAVPSPLSPQPPQDYIGAHDYLVMVAAAPPPSPLPQTTTIDDQDAGAAAAAAAATAEPLESVSSNRISTVHSADFRYGRVEVRAKTSSRGFSGFWLVPSDGVSLGHTPCARVAIAEVK